MWLKGGNAGSMVLNRLFSISSCLISQISSEPLARIDYIEILNAETFCPTDKIVHNTLVAAAVYFGNTRLIDNFTFEGETK